MKRVFILGAGASAHAGAPLGNDILKKYIDIRLENLKRSKSKTAPILGNFETLMQILFIQPNCKFTHLTSLEDLKKENLPNIEDVFTLYDIAYQKDEPFLFEADIDLNIIRKDLFYVLTFTMIRSTIGAMNENGTTKTYQDFIGKISREDTIISYNYDTLLDNALHYKFKELNYGYEFLTEWDTIIPRPEEERQELIKSISEEMKISPEEVVEKFFHPRNPKINFGEDAPLLIKPHGSLNWLYCPKCYRYYCLTHNELINMSFYGTYTPSECGDYCGGNLHQFIVPLTHHKTFQNPLLNNLWMKVNQSLSTAEEVYFIGYSIPDVDYTSKYYFIKGLSRPNRKLCAKIALIAPNAEGSGLSDKYRSFFGDITEIIDDHEYEVVEIKLGDKIFKTPQIKEMRYKFGKEKFTVIEKRFEEWVNEF